MKERFQETIEACASLQPPAAPLLPPLGCVSSVVTSSTLTGVVCDRLITNLRGEPGNYRAQTNDHN